MLKLLVGIVFSVKKCTMFNIGIDMLYSFYKNFDNMGTGYVLN